MKTIHIEAENLPEAFEKAVVEVWKNGTPFKTEYDKEVDPLSKDSTMLLNIKNPMAEPRIPKNICMGLNDIEKYRQEILIGAHNYYMSDLSNPDRWQYTYNQRLFEYEVNCDCGGIKNQDDAGFHIGCKKCNGSGKIKINQIEKCIELLKKCNYSRRIRAITWQPWNDLGHKEPCCLQSLAFRVEKDIDTGKEKLNMNVIFRSNDLYKAFVCNALILSEIQDNIAKEIGVECGHLIWLSESMHLNGSYFKEIEGFMKYIENTKPEERAFYTKDCNEMFLDGIEELLKEEKMPQEKKNLILERKQFLENQL